jgi:hypothetical protein
MKLYFYILCILTIFVLDSCCKKQKCKCEKEWGEEVEDCTPKHYGPYYLGEVKDYLYFKSGSWWVYENNLSGETDSIYTILCDTAINSLVGKNKPWLSLTYTSIGFRLRSDKYDVDYFYDEPLLNLDVTDFGFGHAFNRRALFPTTAGSSAPFCFPFQSEKNFKEILPSIVIKGITYTEVAVFEVGSDNSVQHPTEISYPLYFLSNAKYFWAKNYGLIKIEARTYRNDTSQEIINSWELIKHNLIR